MDCLDLRGAELRAAFGLLEVRMEPACSDVLSTIASSADVDFPTTLSVLRSDRLHSNFLRVHDIFTVLATLTYSKISTAGAGRGVLQPGRPRAPVQDLAAGRGQRAGAHGRRELVPRGGRGGARGATRVGHAASGAR